MLGCESSAIAPEHEEFDPIVCVCTSPLTLLQKRKNYMKIPGGGGRFEKGKHKETHVKLAKLTNWFSG